MYPPVWSKAKGAECKDWANSARLLGVKMGEYGLQVLDLIAQDDLRGDLTFKIYRPGSLLKAVDRKVSDLRLGKVKVTDAVAPDLAEYLKEREAQKEKNRVIMAEARQRQAAMKAGLVPGSSPGAEVVQ
jgi:hypothetical protein